MTMLSLPILTTHQSPREILTEIQSYGLRWVEPEGSRTLELSRKGGAGPSDHKAVTFEGQTIMAPIHTAHSKASPYEARVEPGGRHALLLRGESALGTLTFPETPKFYGLRTAEGVPYWKIALLHSTDVLATTVLQQCIRYRDRATSCQFCAIGQSLEAGRTIARKSPGELAEVAEAAVRLDGVKHMVMTTGTPGTPDRGARVLCEAAEAVTRVVDLPIQAQCEPPAEDAWFTSLRGAGVVSLGMHLEAVTERVRRAIMPGKAEVPVSRYLEAFEAAIAVFGRGQVSTYLLAGLGDTEDDLLAMCETLITLGVYPFVVPFVPIAGTPLEHHAPPKAAFMQRIFATLGPALSAAGLRASDVRAGCGRCGACSSLRSYEVS
jgi:radical SAM protein (TIGR04043 family)